jgi:surface antigen
MATPKLSSATKRKLSLVTKSGAVAAMSLATVVSVSALAPAASAATVSPSVTNSPVPTYSSPYDTRLATTHKVTAPAITAYPWANDQTKGSDPYGETMRQCVSYVAWYLNSHGTPFGYNTQGPRGTATFGNATTWDAAAIKDGFTVSLKPLVGSVAQWHSNEISTWTVPGGYYTLQAGSFGHVAIVTAVYSNGNVDLAQYNMGGNRAFSVMHNVRAPRYIYVPLASPNVP